MKNLLKNKVTTLKPHLKNYSYCLGIATAFVIFSHEAMAFDLDKGIKAAFNPLIKGITDHWGKALTVSGVVSALIGEGDMRTRAVKAGLGCGAAGAVVLGALAVGGGEIPQQ